MARGAAEIILRIIVAISLTPVSIADGDLCCGAALERFHFIVEAVVPKAKDLVVTVVAELCPASTEVAVVVDEAAMVAREV